MSVPAWYIELTTGVQTATGVAVFIAGIRAWSNWKNQFRNTEDHNMARELLKEAYRLRDAIGIIRNPFTSIRRFDDTGRELNREQQHDERVKLYEGRLEEGRKCRTNLDVRITEAEALWGEPVREWCMPVIKAHSTVVGNLFTMLDLESPRTTETIRVQQKDLLDKCRKIVWSGYTDPDEFDKQVIEALDSLRAILKPRMISHMKS